MPLGKLRDHVRELEEQALYAVLDKYARLYAGVIPVLLALSFVPYYESSDQAWWDAFDEPFGELFMLIAIPVLAAATAGVVWTRSPTPPIVTAIGSGVQIVLLCSGFGATSDDDLSWAGSATVAISFGLVAVAIGHVVHIRVLANDIALMRTRKLPSD